MKQKEIDDVMSEIETKLFPMDFTLVLKDAGEQTRKKII